MGEAKQETVKAQTSQKSALPSPQPQAASEELQESEIDQESGFRFCLEQRPGEDLSELLRRGSTYLIEWEAGSTGKHIADILDEMRYRLATGELLPD